MTFLIDVVQILASFLFCNINTCKYSYNHKLNRTLFVYVRGVQPFTRRGPYHGGQSLQ